MVFVLLVSILFSMTPYLPDIGGRFGEREGIKIDSANAPSVNEQPRTLL